MMEIYVLSMISFVAVVYAYLTGVKHGLSVSKARVPTPIKDAVMVAKNAIQEPKGNEPDVMEQMLTYDYETALQAVKKQHMEGR